MTVNWLKLQHRSHEEFGSRLASVTDWDAPTPDDGWSVGDLVRHVIDGQRAVPMLLAGSPAPASVGPEADLPAEWAHASRAALAAWLSVPSGTTVRLSTDVVSAEDYLTEQVADVTIHAWDLARATGTDDTLDAELVAATWTIYEPQQDTLSLSGLFAPAVPLPDDAPLQSRLLAVTGRDVRRH
ncbi:TIGR03086 family metal-binding protein [Planctomonas psychrotolerans]|uniref:TIGR03086 family metal-binding protein n=1 Tax=Planctomonas psychrotolerans TaxID=2528712 RepID=UPI00123BA4D2|nr:TIGR03086 family metal-binding protein [Planctomonas psychrotolerans]